MSLACQKSMGPSAPDHDRLLPMTEKQQPNFAADLTLLAAAVIWGLNVVAMKYAISLLNPFWFNACRFVFSVLTLALWTAINRQRASGGRSGGPDSGLSRFQYVGTIVLYAFLFGLIYQVAFLMGIFNTSASSAALIMASVPMWTAIIAIIFLRERLSPISWLGLVMTFAGTMIVALIKPGSESVAVTSTLVGNGIMLFCALSWSVSTVISRPVLHYISPVELTFWGMGLALPCHIAIALFQTDADITIAWQPKVTAAILYSGIFSTGIALALWSYGVKILGASHASIYGNLIPLVALFFGWLMLGEIPTIWQWVGGGMIICGLLTMRRG